MGMADPYTRLDTDHRPRIRFNKRHEYFAMCRAHVLDMSGNHPVRTCMFMHEGSWEACMMAANAHYVDWHGPVNRGS